MLREYFLSQYKDPVMYQSVWTMVHINPVTWMSRDGYFGSMVSKWAITYTFKLTFLQKTKENVPKTPPLAEEFQAEASQGKDWVGETGRVGRT